MSLSYYFYDLETSGFRAASDRIMQFAGQRTDSNLNPIGKTDNILLKLPDDILPSPSAVLFTGLSLKENQLKGINENEFAKYFSETIATEGTVFVGFNNLRFDDEFIRYLLYRNFYDPYSWHWSNNRSRWDILDPVRMTRALRPDGIIWPSNEEGINTNKLEALTKANKLDHFKAHDALSDVKATIQVAKLIQSRQPKLFNYLLKLRDKKLSNEVINSKQPFVYTTGRYSSDNLQTSLVLTMEFNPKASVALVYDLRVDPRPLLNMSIESMADKWRYDPEKPKEDLPIKTIKLNRCPAVAPVSVLDKDSITRLKLDMSKLSQNAKLLKENMAAIKAKLDEVIGVLNSERDSRQRSRDIYADQQLYSGFISPSDQKIADRARSNPPDVDLHFSDNRLNDLYFIYLARNYPKLLEPSQKERWHKLVNKRLFEGDPSVFSKFNIELKEQKEISKNTKLIKELENYAKKVESEYGKP